MGNYLNLNLKMNIPAIPQREGIELANQPSASIKDPSTAHFGPPGQP